MDNEKTSPSETILVQPRRSIKLILVLIFLCFNALGNAIGTIMQIQLNNMQAAAIYFITFLLYLLPAYGLYRFKRWARFLQLVLSIIFVFQGFVLMYSGQLFVGMINVVLYGLTGIYLLSDEGRQLFR